MSDQVTEDIIPQKNKLNLRLAGSLRDLEFLRPVSLEFHAESRYSDIQYSHKKRDDLFVQAFKKPDVYALMIAEFNDEPVGFMFCTIGEYIVGTGDLITTVYSFYVRKKYRGSSLGGKAAIHLLKGLIRWSENRKAREVMIHVTSGIDIQRTDKFLRRSGFGVIGANYSFGLKRQEKNT